MGSNQTTNTARCAVFVYPHECYCVVRASPIYSRVLEAPATGVIFVAFISSYHRAINTITSIYENTYIRTTTFTA
jgi:hypothetical protein